MNPTVTDATPPDQRPDQRPGIDGPSAATSTPPSGRKVYIRIRRQDGPGKPSRWEEFAVPHRPNMNIISCLMHIATHPRTTEGVDTTPVVYDSGCLEEVCGACTMIINGKVRQSCSALVDRLGPPGKPTT